MFNLFNFSNLMIDCGIRGIGHPHVRSYSFSQHSLGALMRVASASSVLLSLAWSLLVEAGTLADLLLAQLVSKSFMVHLSGSR